MAKAKMKKISVVALREDRKRVLEHLQDSGLVQINSKKEPRGGFETVNTANRVEFCDRSAALAAQALTILNDLAPEKKGLAASFKGRRIIEKDQIGVFAEHAEDVLETCRRIVELQKQCNEGAAQRVRLLTSLDQLSRWRPLDVPLDTDGTKTTSFFIGTLPKFYSGEELAAALAEQDSELIFDFEIVFAGKSMTYLCIMCPREQREQMEDALRQLSFTRPLNLSHETPARVAARLEQQLGEIEEATAKAKEDIISLAPMRRDIQDTQDYFIIRRDKYEVISGLEHSAHTFVITGYVPADDAEKVQKMLERICPCDVEFEDADDEDTPVKLKNNAFSAPAQSITAMYSLPGKNDIDPTPVMSIFFYFFFGMMFSDAGYGLIMVIGLTLALKLFKPEKAMADSMRFFRYCGISTTLWGAAFGSFFGDAPVAFYNFNHGTSYTMPCLIDPQKDALTLLIISIAFGLIQILVGLGCKFYILWRGGDRKGAIFDVGFWMTMLVGLGVLAAGMKLHVLIKVGAGIAIASALGLVLTQGRSKKNPFARLLSGVVSLYDVTSYISDLLSYSRLLALGLTTGVMAQVFNLLSTMFGKAWWSYIALTVVFIIGHAVTFALNVLGSYVHTMRLQYVELFSKFYEGGGKPFAPFELNSKYFRIQEENKND